MKLIWIIVVCCAAFVVNTSEAQLENSNAPPRSGEPPARQLGPGGGGYSWYKPHPDIKNERPMPEWAKPNNTSMIFNELSNLMNVPINSENPYIRFWPNLTAEDRQACPGCVPGLNYFVEDRKEIWLGSDQDRNDMIDEIIKYLQQEKRGYDPDALESNFAQGEREFFRKKLEEVLHFRWEN